MLGSKGTTGVRLGKTANPPDGPENHESVTSDGRTDSITVARSVLPNNAHEKRIAKQKKKKEGKRLDGRQCLCTQVSLIHCRPQKEKKRKKNKNVDHGNPSCPFPRTKSKSAVSPPAREYPIRHNPRKILMYF